MNKDFVPYEPALELKQLGFDEPCFVCKVIGQEHLDYTPTDYDDFPEQKEKEVLIPTFSQAFRFFREKYGIVAYVTITEVSNKYVYYVNQPMWGDNFNKYDTYEEAEHACLLKLIELAKQVNK